MQFLAQLLDNVADTWRHQSDADSHRFYIFQNPSL